MSLLPLRKNSEQVISVPRAIPPKVFEIATIIALGTTVSGDFDLRDGIRIDGIVRGRVAKRGGPDADEVTVHVAPTGEIHGDIVADNVIVEGRVFGTVCAIKHLIVKGRITGKASYGESVDLKGEIDASISRLGHMEARDLTASEAEAPAAPSSPTPADPPVIPATAHVDGKADRAEDAISDVARPAEAA
jgi:cytoskeletal protein CcmA (bactofilin family)